MRCAVAVRQGAPEQKRRIEFPSASTGVTTSSTTMTFSAMV